MADNNIVISEVRDVTTVTLHIPSLLDGLVIEDIGRCLFGLVDKKAIRKLIVDFQDVKFLSSSMLGILVSLQKRIAGIDGQLVLCGMRADLMKIFEITQLDKILTFANDESAAAKKFEF